MTTIRIPSGHRRTSCGRRPTPRRCRRCRRSRRRRRRTTTTSTNTSRRSSSRRMNHAPLQCRFGHSGWTITRSPSRRASGCSRSRSPRWRKRLPTPCTNTPGGSGRMNRAPPDWRKSRWKLLVTLPEDPWTSPPPPASWKSSRLRPCRSSCTVRSPRARRFARGSTTSWTAEARAAGRGARTTLSFSAVNPTDSDSDSIKTTNTRSCPRVPTTPREGSRRPITRRRGTRCHPRWRCAR